MTTWWASQRGDLPDPHGWVYPSAKHPGLSQHSFLTPQAGEVASFATSPAVSKRTGVVAPVQNKERALLNHAPTPRAHRLASRMHIHPILYHTFPVPGDTGPWTNFDPTEVYNYVAPLCLWLCTLCRSHFHSGQMWPRQTDSTVATARPHHCGAGIRLAHGVGGGGTVPAFYHCPQNLALFGSVWLCHRGILALLFQGFAAGQHQPSGPS